MKRRLRIGQFFALPAVLGFVASACSTPGARAPESTPLKVVLVSLDGFRPDFYQGTGFQTPHLRKLVRLGTSAKTALPPYPSVTYPSHATIVTGASPSVHGIFANTLWSESTGQTNNWYWNEDQIKVQTLWQAAKAAGKSVGSLGWPTTLGAKVDWLVPEVFSTPGIDQNQNWEMLERHTNPDLLSKLTAHSDIKKTTNSDDHDRLITDSAIYLLRTYSPDLLLLHYRSVDLAQHLEGRESAAVHRTVEKVDALLGNLFEAIDPATTALIIAGDHGFMDARKAININLLFVEKGWIQLRDGKVSDWKVLAEANGGEATIHIKDPSKDPALQSAVLKLLEKNARGRYTIVTKEQLRELRTLPTALCALDPLEGYSIGNAVQGKLVVKTKSIQGQHGYLPTHPKMGTGFIAVGPGINANARLDQVRLLDIAATISSLMKIPAPVASEGQPIPLIRN